MNKMNAITLSAIIAISQVWLSNATENIVWETTNSVGSIIDKTSKIKKKWKLIDLKSIPNKKWEINTNTTNFWMKWKNRTDLININLK